MKRLLLVCALSAMIFGGFADGGDHARAATFAAAPAGLCDSMNRVCYCFEWAQNHKICRRWGPGPPPPPPVSNYNGWDGNGAIMCQSNHNGWQIGQPDPVYGGYHTFTCGFAYDPGPGLYYPGYGYVNSCPTGAPFYGYCWRWQD